MSLIDADDAAPVVEAPAGAERAGAVHPSAHGGAARFAGSRPLVWLLLTSLFVYSYFFQGYGYNQNAHFLTTRAIVEHGTLEITSLVGALGDPFYTGDTGVIDGRVYSSKAPGLALYAAPVYFVMREVERAAGVDAAAPRVAQMNQYLLTLWTSALPAAVLVACIYLALRDDPIGQIHAPLLTAAFAFGTLALPYAGVMMTHNLVATCLFGAWLLLRRNEPPTPGAALAAGALLGLALLCEYIVAPVVGFFGVWTIARSSHRRQAAQIAAGPAVAGVAILLIHWLAFGHPFATSYGFVNDYYKDPSLLLGIFGWPDPRRLYWLSLHPHRGLLYACPVFVLCLLALLQSGWRDVLRRRAFPLIVFGYFLLVNLSFHGWTGGFAVGPRYLIPGLAFLFLLVPVGFARYPRIGMMLIVISVLNMLAVTAVRLQWPGPSFGPPIPDDPVALSFRRLTFNQVARDPGSFNLGQLLGLNGVWSVAPAVFAVITCLALCWGPLRWRSRRPRPLPQDLHIA